MIYKFNATTWAQTIFAQFTQNVDQIFNRDVTINQLWLRTLQTIEELAQGQRLRYQLPPTRNP